MSYLQDYLRALNDNYAVVDKGKDHFPTAVRKENDNRPLWDWNAKVLEDWQGEQGEQDGSQGFVSKAVDPVQKRGFLDSLKDLGLGAFNSLAAQPLGSLGSMLNKMGPDNWALGDTALNVLTRGATRQLERYKGRSGAGSSNALIDMSHNLGADESSPEYLVGNIAGMLGGATIATKIATKALGALTGVGRAAQIATGAGIGGAQTALYDWNALQGTDPEQPKLSTAEYLARVGAGTIAGGGAARLAAVAPKIAKPIFNTLSHVGIDAAIGAGSQNAIDVAQYLAADTEERKRQIASGMLRNALTGAAVNVGVGLGTKAAQKLPAAFNQLKSKLGGQPAAPNGTPTATTPPNAPTPPGAQAAAAPAATPSAGQPVVDPYVNIEPVITQHIASLPPEEIALLQSRTGTAGLAPDAMAADIAGQARATDTMGTGSGLEWIDSMLGVDWHQKGAPAQAVEQPRVIEPVEHAPMQQQPVQEAQYVEQVPVQEAAAQEVPPVVEQPVIQEPITGEPSATQEGVIPTNDQPEHQGAPLREDVRPNTQEVRQEESPVPVHSDSPERGGQGAEEELTQRAIDGLVKNGWPADEATRIVEGDMAKGSYRSEHEDPRSVLYDPIESHPELQDNRVIVPELPHMSTPDLMMELQHEVASKSYGTDEHHVGTGYAKKAYDELIARGLTFREIRNHITSEADGGDMRVADVIDRRLYDLAHGNKGDLKGGPILADYSASDEPHSQPTGDEHVQSRTENNANGEPGQRELGAKQASEEVPVSKEEAPTSAQGEEEGVLKYDPKVVRDELIQRVTDEWNAMNPNAVKPFKASDIEKAFAAHDNAAPGESGNHPKLDELIARAKTEESLIPLAKNFRELEKEFSTKRESTRRNPEQNNSQTVIRALGGEVVSTPINNFKPDRAVRRMVKIIEDFTGQKLPKASMLDQPFDFTHNGEVIARVARDKEAGTVSLDLNENLISADAKLQQGSADYALEKQGMPSSDFTYDTQQGGIDPYEELRSEANPDEDLASRDWGDIRDVKSRKKNADRDRLRTQIRRLERQNAKLPEEERTPISKELYAEAELDFPGDKTTAKKAAQAEESSPAATYDSAVQAAVERIGGNANPRGLKRLVDSYGRSLAEGKRIDPEDYKENTGIKLQDIAELHGIKQNLERSNTRVDEIEKDVATIADLPDAPAETQQMRGRRKGGASSAQIVQSTLGMVPYAAAQDLEDDKEYLPGVTGRTIKTLALSVGAFMMVGATGRKMLGIGSKLVPGRRATLFELARRPFTDKRGIINTANNIADATGLSAKERAALQKNLIERDAALNSNPIPTGAQGLQSLKLVNDPMAKRLGHAVAEGEVKGKLVAITVKQYRKALTSLPKELAHKVSVLNREQDNETTKLLEKLLPKDPTAADMRDPKIVQELNNWKAARDAKLQQSNPELYAAMKSLEKPRERMLRAQVEGWALEHTGWQIDEGIKEYASLAQQYKHEVMQAVARYRTLQKSGAPVQDLTNAMSALNTLDVSLHQALRVRNQLEYWKSFRDLSVARGYMPRWFDNINSPYAVRVKQTASDPGELIPFYSKAERDKFLSYMHEELDPHFVSGGAVDPKTGEPINTYQKLYNSQGGKVEAVEKGNIFSINNTQEALNPGVIGQLLGEFERAAASGGLPSERAKAFFDAYGKDINALVDAKSLADIGLSSDIMGTGKNISAKQLRQLINVIGMPKHVNNFAYRSNVDGYAPGLVDVLTGKPNPHYAQDTHEWELAGLDFLENKIQKSVASGWIMREANAQAAELASLGIGKRYMKFLTNLVTGVRWNDSVSVMPRLASLDRALQSAMIFKFMTGNVPSYIKNYALGYVNSAAEAAATKGLIRGMKNVAKGDVRYVQYMKDKMTGREFAEFLSDPAHVSDLTSNINSTLRTGGDDLRAVYRLAHESGMFDAQLVKSLERNLPRAVRKANVLKWVEKIGLGGTQLVEDHNRTASFLVGAEAHLADNPGDIEGALIRGQQFMNNSQGNFNQWAMSWAERTIKSVPLGRSLTTLATAGLRSSEQLGVHFLAALGDPANAKVYAPIMAALVTMGIHGGLSGSPGYGDAWSLLRFTSNKLSGEDKAGRVPKENWDEMMERSVSNFAENSGVDRELARKLYRDILYGYDTQFTGRNLSSQNNLSDLALENIFASTLESISTFVNKFPKADREGKLREFLKLTTVEGSRIHRALENYNAGREVDRNGNPVGKPTTVGTSLADAFLGSRFEDVQGALSHIEGGGSVHSNLEAKSYVASLDNLDGLTLTPRHKAYFQVRIPGSQEPQFLPRKVNDYRERLINNYQSMSQQRKQAEERMSAALENPANAKKIVTWALGGQEASRRDNSIESMKEGVLKKVREYYVAEAANKAFVDLGLPVAPFKWKNKEFGAAMQYMTRKTKSQQKSAAESRRSRVEEYQEED